MRTINQFFAKYDESLKPYQQNNTLDLCSIDILAYFGLYLLDTNTTFLFCIFWIY